MINNKRVRHLSTRAFKEGQIIYWMDRDQRVHDNWALLCAQRLAICNGRSLGVIFVIPENASDFVWRRHSFIIENLKEVEKELEAHNIPLFVLVGDPVKESYDFVKKNNVGCLITDFSPLKHQRQWRDSLANKLNIPVCEVDARNIVPAWEVSKKLITDIDVFRKNIQAKIDEYLVDFPKVKKHKTTWEMPIPRNDWEKIANLPQLDRSVTPVGWLRPGQKEAHKVMRFFLKKKLSNYQKYTDPNEDVLSNLSPYLHFGMISSQRVALETMKSGHDLAVREIFLDHIIVRRELAENYCFYNPDYDKPKRFFGISKVKDPKRSKSVSYSEKDYENANTRDDLWNAAQMELIKTGKMHGLLRVYWAKKILEWSGSTEKAMDTAIYLNNKYELDGADSNTYAGIALAIGGLHDQDGAKHSRYMNYNDKINFNVYRYIDKWRVDEPTQLSV